MADGNFDYLTQVKLLLGISGSDYDDLLNLYISIVQQEILNYCNINELPSALNLTVCQMTCDLYNDNQKKTIKNSVVGNISSISEDGRSVSFTNGTELITSVQDKISNITILNRYRKLYRV